MRHSSFFSHDVIFSSFKVLRIKIERKRALIPNKDVYFRKYTINLGEMKKEASQGYLF